MGPKLRAGIALAFVLALGVLIGIAVERHHSSLRRSHGITPANAHQAALTELRTELDLTDEQVQTIHEVVGRNREVVLKTWEAFRPEVQEAMEQVHLEIAEILTPAQRERFHEWLLERREAGDEQYQFFLHER